MAPRWSLGVRNFYERTNWLWKFLNPATQPPLIKEFLDRENEFLLTHIQTGTSVFVVGCGFGRHLKLLAPIIASGVGVDIDPRRIQESKPLLRNYPFVRTFVGDASNLPTIKRSSFDYVLCMNNTFGNLNEKKLAVLKEMKRIVKNNGTIILSVYASKSVPERVTWYKNTGLTGIKTSRNRIVTQQGLISEHFSKQSLQAMFRAAALEGRISSFGPISFMCLLQKGS